ncbi:Hydrogenase transcriptional regulatory protein hupR1 [Roseimaritima multifibrata]|uniref:Hydrogenase transcriptional regulatory protein hupR1 n=1 Tax=Roseimaritima multifibrata TaxID=1930274 RepID=A0A517MLD2_9BACT|nr:response regulator [Roseimaritima multifibrata]QDS95698.1 Hydrogenase transcriptional regulatory protein hupR1 [Roseimaritima multifibrata]
MSLVNRKVLFVDDDQKLLQGIERRFGDRFDLQVADSAKHALTLFDRKSPFAVVVSDMRMPVMDGLEFIERARQSTKHTVYMMLTGNQDLTTASEAVNRGQVFRFLTKPCPSRLLGEAIEAGIQQYSLLQVEQDLLQNTFCGSVVVLTEVLELAHPKLFRRSHAVSAVLAQIMKHLGIEECWEYRLAAQLANVGCVVSLSDESAAADGIGSATIGVQQAQAGKRLIRNIPRLEAVAEMVGNHPTAIGKFTLKPSSTQERIESGATLVRAAMEAEAFERSGLPSAAIAQAVTARMPEIPSLVVDAFPTACGSRDAGGATRIVIEVTARQLREGMVLAEHVESQADGSRLMSKGTRLSQSYIERLQHIVRRELLKPIFVFKPATSGSPLSGDAKTGSST